MRPRLAMITATGGSSAATTDIPTAAGTDQSRTRFHASTMRTTQAPMIQKYAAFCLSFTLARYPAAASRHRPHRTAVAAPKSAQVSTSNRSPAEISRAVRRSPIACAVVTQPAVGGLSSRARLSADSASMREVSV